MVKLGVGMPQTFVDGKIEPRAIRDYLMRAEALGFLSAWTAENILGTTPNLDALELMSFAAACTDRMQLGCAVLLTPVRGPIHLAKSLATLDHLSQGRLIAGIGLGTPRFDPAFGIDSSTRVSRFAEGIQVMKALWTQPTVTLHGRFWQLVEVPMEPKPFTKPHMPLWIGAHHPAALKRAVQLGDGFIGAGSSSTAQFKHQVQTVRACLSDLKRDPATFPISKRVYIAVDDDAERAEKRLEEYGRGNMPEVAVWGPPDVCAATLREVAQAGATLIVLSPLFDFAEQLERFAADLVPRLRD